MVEVVQQFYVLPRLNILKKGACDPLCCHLKLSDCYSVNLINKRFLHWSLLIISAAR